MTASAPKFSVRLIQKKDRSGATEYLLNTTDKFHKIRYRVERTSFRLFVNGMERYLKKRPNLTFDNPKNRVRKIVYFPHAIKAWANYMPGGFATFHVHNPDHKYLVSGEKLDYITKNLFRHSADAIGLRSRAYVMMWFVKKKLSDRKRLTWLSIASGTGQATFDAISHLGIPAEIHLLDIDKPSLEFAQNLALEYGFSSKNVHLKEIDLKKSTAYKTYLKKTKPDVVEAMGIAEYLNDEELISLIKQTLSVMKPGGMLIFTNMLPSHPHLQVHKRGLGWPGVIQRRIFEVEDILSRAGVNLTTVSILRPSDKVYAVYAIIKQSSL